MKRVYWGQLQDRDKCKQSDDLEIVSYLSEDGRMWEDRAKGRNILSGCDGHLRGEQKTITD